MNVTPWYEEAMRMASSRDVSLFNNWTGHLPIRPEGTPYHSGPHSIRNFRIAYDLSGAPKNVLEIGFCLGHSASAWLALGVHLCVSIDNSTREETSRAEEAMYAEWGKQRFRLIRGSTESLKFEPDSRFDLAFIDGDHGIEAVDRDTKFCLDLGISFLLFDDWFTHWSEGVQPAVEKHRLVPIAILGSMALCVPAKNLT